jgi:pyruvate dehydrogenase E2 component (dihydrolipoamide acetyltransferase)
MSIPEHESKRDNESMAMEFKLPELGENIESGELVRLMIKPGGSIAEGEPVMELETDKAVVEVPSSVTGTIGEIRVKEGDKLRVGQVIFTVENGSGAEATPPPKKKRPAQTENAAAAAATATPVTPAATAAPQPERRTAVRSSSSSSMANEFRLPELGENIDSGDLVRLMISPGTSVSEGQPVMELETDKAVVEVPSTVSGIVRDIKVKEGQKVKVGEVIFTLQGGAAPAAQPARRHEPVEHISGQQAARLGFQLAMRAEGKTEEQALPLDRPQAPAAEFSMPVQLGKVAGTDHDPIPAAPHVRRLAREIGVNIRSVPGSGPGGRISEDDVKLCAKNALMAAAAAQAPRGSFVEPELPDFAKWGKTERVSMRGVRRKTAEHLRQAWNTIPHVTQQDRADITELEQLRAKFAPRAEEAGGKMTVTAIALKVCASALKVFPNSMHRLIWARRNYLQAVHQHRRCSRHRSRAAGAGDSRRGQEKYCRARGGDDAALEESARPQAHSRRDGRRDFHHHQSRRNRRHRFFSHRESSRSSDSGPVAFAHGAGVGEQQIRAALDSSALALVRSPVDRWRRRCALSALDRGSLRAAVPAFGAGIDAANETEC